MNGLMGITVKALAILKAKRGLISIIISVALVVVAVIAVQRAWNYGNIEKENKALQASLSDATSKLDELAKTQEQLAHSEKEVRLLKESTNALKEQVADLNIEKEDLNNQLSEIFCKNRQNLVEQRITPHFLTANHPNYYGFTTKG